ncbi:MAG: hypothetical protein E6G97_15135 [Alphaproteobacteria bacterium]|nr:MAG: hypothetical protein E6G97_15135 [Alphaproteobacteria bacterium]
MPTNVSLTDRIGNGIVAGFIATLVLSALHEPVTLLTAAVGVRAPVAGLLFHFFVGTLLWGSVFGLVHDYLFGPDWLRGVMFAGGAAVVVMLVIAPLTGSGLFCLKLGVFAPVVVALFHLAYGAILGAIYGKLIDTDEARAHLHHAHH